VVGGNGKFPDQYQLDRIIEIEASAHGWDHGYSGWVQVEDGRVFVVTTLTIRLPRPGRSVDNSLCWATQIKPRLPKG
jgi:hypothetical protein